MATDDTIDDTLQDSVEVHPLILEVFAETDGDMLKDELQNLGYILDEKYGSVPTKDLGGKPTELYRVLIPLDLKDDAYDVLSALDFVYDIWEDAHLEPMGLGP